MNALMLVACTGRSVPVASPAATPAPSIVITRELPESTPTIEALPALSTSLPEAELSNFGAAPELTNAVWLNVDHPLRLADLRGSVVLIDMWTFG